MTAPPKKTSTRTALPSDGELFQDRIEFFSSEHRLDPHAYKPSEQNVAIVCPVGKDLGGPTNEVGIFAKLVNSIINKIRALTD